MSAITHYPGTTPPTPAAASLAQDSAQSLLKIVAASGLQESVLLTIDCSAEKIPVPTAALKLLADVLIEMGKGHAVTLLPSHVELSTQEAADILNVSRPFLIEELERGEIPFRRVGTHRRLSLLDVLAYKQQQRALRMAALDELTAQAQELDMGY